MGPSKDRDAEHEEIKNGYETDRKLIMARLDDLLTATKEIQVTLGEHKTELALIKQKAGLWGGALGILGAIATLGAAWIRSRL